MLDKKIVFYIINDVVDLHAHSQAITRFIEKLNLGGN